MSLMFRKNRRAIAELVYAAIAAASLAAAFLLRFDFTIAPPYQAMLLEALPLLLVAKLSVFRIFSLRDLAWRYFGFRDLLRLGAGNLAASLAATLLLRLDIGSAFPRSIHIIDLLVCFTLLSAAHAAGKLAWENSARHGPRRGPQPKRIGIYGAGKAGAMLALEIQAHPQAGLEAIAFFDDDPLKHGLRIHGIRVAGGLNQLAPALRRQRIASVLLALPSASGERVAAIVEQCRAAGSSARRVPALDELEGGHSLLRQIRDVRIEDLLGRRPVAWDAGCTLGRLRGATVLVTGAGGSIGSELCRQIARCDPAAIVGFDHSEAALYEIDREMGARHPGLTFRAEIGSIRNFQRLEEVFRRHSPQAVYHAAAYKHVPLMEAQLFEAIENNVFGTRNVARAAIEFGAREMVLISSDKAVHPANVMGATKRLAEMVIQSMTEAGAPDGTRLLAVRFGNVLGSSGSVIPVFRDQIARGGPVTVTHPDMQRFFMTIPEAAQLVLHAAALGTQSGCGGGNIFVLEMGQPVRIVDLARQMISLSGLDPGRDISIEFTGVRPGEKLTEELSAYQESTLPTPHPQIRIYAATPPPARELNETLQRLHAAVTDRDALAAVDALQELIPSYRPSAFLRRAVEEKASSVYA